MSDKDDQIDELLEALKRNTAASDRVSASLQDVSNSLNDMVVSIEAGEFIDDEDFEEPALGEFSFRPEGSGNA